MSATTVVTERQRNMISGAIGVLLLFAAIVIGVKASFGAYRGGYELQGTFTAAGQGLIPGSDVKVRGVNVGEVKRVELVQNRALVTMRIEDSTRVPVSTQAIVRPKTLFGEKFIDLDLGAEETTGPFLADGDEIADTLGGFELEQVLADAYPVLEAVDPVELATVVSELADAADGLGENINRSLVNGAALADLAASNDAEFRSFTNDLALLSEELDRLSPALLRGARDLNVALPTINENADSLGLALVDLGRIAGDLADVLENNRSFTENALTNGSRQIQLLFDHRADLQPLLQGVQRYTQTIASSLRIEIGDGTLMAAVKSVLGPVPLPAVPLSQQSPSSASAGLEPVDPAPGLTGMIDRVGSALLGILAGEGRQS